MLKRLLQTSMLVAAMLCASRADAAFISIDDSDLDFITISAGDFEGGFSIDGTLLTSGLGNSASITLPDGGYGIDGSWIDLGLADGASLDFLFALPGDITAVTSGVQFVATSDGINATLSGSFGGFTGVPYFVTALATGAQDGHTESGGPAFLSVSYKSEAVPEPASLVLLGSGLALAAVRRRA